MQNIGCGECTNPSCTRTTPICTRQQQRSKALDGLVKRSRDKTARNKLVKGLEDGDQREERRGGAGSSLSGDKTTCNVEVRLHVFDQHNDGGELCLYSVSYDLVDVSKEMKLSEIREIVYAAFVVLGHLAPGDRGQLKFWNEGGTPMVKDEMTLCDYNCFQGVQGKVVLHTGLQYPPTVKEAYDKYYGGLSMPTLHTTIARS